MFEMMSCGRSWKHSSVSAVLQLGDLDVDVIFFHGKVTVAARVGAKIRKELNENLFESSLNFRRFALIIGADNSRVFHDLQTL